MKALVNEHNQITIDLFNPIIGEGIEAQLEDNNSLHQSLAKGIADVLLFPKGIVPVSANIVDSKIVITLVQCDLEEAVINKLSSQQGKTLPDSIILDWNGKTDQTLDCDLSNGDCKLADTKHFDVCDAFTSLIWAEDGDTLSELSEAYEAFYGRRVDNEFIDKCKALGAL